ncbi:MAG: hypothetical protein ACXVI9_12400 [Mucilaginibacter sp.]
MKRLTLNIVLLLLSATAFAQFPLRASKENITAYFADNMQYASFQEFKTKSGNDAFCYTKTRILGDYTFYFNQDGTCNSFTETFDRKQLDELTWRYDRKFCRISATEWVDEDNSVHITLSPHPKKGANYMSLTYRSVEQAIIDPNTLAVN